MLLDLLDRELVRSALRSVMISREPDLAVFDRAFDLVFAPGTPIPDEPAVTVDADVDAIGSTDGRGPRVRRRLRGRARRRRRDARPCRPRSGDVRR